MLDRFCNPPGLPQQFAQIVVDMGRVGADADGRLEMPCQVGGLLLGFYGGDKLPGGFLITGTLGLGAPLFEHRDRFRPVA